MTGRREAGRAMDPPPRAGVEIDLFQHVAFRVAGVQGHDLRRVGVAIDHVLGAAIAKIGLGQGVGHPGIAVGAPNRPQPCGRGSGPTGRTPLAEPQCPREPVDEVHRAHGVAVADEAAGKQFFRQAVPKLFHALPHRRLGAGPFQEPLDPGGNQEQRAKVVDLAEAQDRRVGQLVPQVPFDLDHEAADEVQRQGVAEAGKVAVAFKAQGIEAVAVPGRHLVAAHGLQEFVAFRNVVREGAVRAVGQAHLFHQLLPQGIIGRAGQVVKPIVIADHVMRADGHRLSVGVGGGPRGAKHRRNGDFAFRRQGAERGERLLVLGKDIARDPVDLVDQPRGKRGVPGTGLALGMPATGMQQVERVAQQNKVDALDGPVSTVAPPGGGDRQFLEPVGKEGKGVRR